MIWKKNFKQNHIKHKLSACLVTFFFLRFEDFSFKICNSKWINGYWVENRLSSLSISQLKTEHRKLEYSSSSENDIFWFLGRIKVTTSIIVSFFPENIENHSNSPLPQCQSFISMVICDSQFFIITPCCIFYNLIKYFISIKKQLAHTWWSGSISIVPH